MLQGEVWFVDPGETKGHELQKSRRCVIVSTNQINRQGMRVVVPLTSWQERFASLPWMVLLKPDAQNRLLVPSAANVLQVRSVSTERLTQKGGVISSEDLHAIQ